jgi:hypothetical protein
VPEHDVGVDDESGGGPAGQAVAALMLVRELPAAARSSARYGVTHRL